ncbi:Fanconi anemia core complex-associated protein 100 [Solea senegalensis]|uniref:Fanconi anemia core complex-associated protein 100 n=1 Tax=Solea senegalensis TaxID=28829 RepID=A0AAV6RMA0_SOLSE|nr:Fanconi anemia core complex-associated protein 100 isoform X1 [Solea senegalensis]KAG7506602.1 Fanconi anemia core complex-associated protein 100 [Solea senegalensis]
MEGRCSVETLADFGFLDASFTPKITPGFGPDLFVLTGSDEVYVFNSEERKLTLVLQFPGPVSDLVQSPDKQLIYVSCSSGVYCVSPQLLLSRTQNHPADVSSGPPELQISSDSLVIGEEGVLSLLLVGSVLLLLSHRDTLWLLSLYKTPEPESSSCELLGSFSLPLVSAAVCDDDEAKMGTRRRPVLICVHSVSTSPSEETLVNSHYHLESVLFKLLFGVDAALAKSPVVLCGLPDGRLCSLPLRLPGSRLRVLHSLEQPVVFVGASVVTETAPGHAQCLVAVGEQGRVLLMKTENPEGGDRAAGFLETCVPGPAVCGSVDKQHLYYSTGSDLLMLDLSEKSSGREGQEKNEESFRKSSAVVHSPTGLKVCRVSALAGPARDATGGVQLLSLSVRGQLQKILLPEERKDLSSHPSAQVCRSAGDLLSAIGDVCERVSALKTAIKSKNQILKHLNQVLNISFLLIEDANTEDQPPKQEKQIRCHTRTRWSRLLQKDSLNLTCVLENSSSFILERGWTLSITVFPVSSSLTAGKESSSTNFSFPFHNLCPGETLDVSLPLAAAGDASFPMRVSCSLLFSLSSLLGEQEVTHLPGLQSSCISLPLNTLTVDWLHVLQVDIKKTTTSHSFYIEADPIQAFLNSHRTEFSRQVETGGREGPSKTEQELFSARIRVSSELLRDMLVSDLNPQGSKSGLCLSLLDWLLSEGPGGGKGGQQRDKIDPSSSVVHARGPNGARVKLTAMEVKVGEEDTGKEDSLSTVDVEVESSSIAAVCGLHHAVLRRIQALMLSAPQRSASTKRLQSLGLRPALQRAERLLHQIQQTRVSGAFGVGVSSGQTTASLLAVYTELRKNPLLIL